MMDLTLIKEHASKPANRPYFYVMFIDRLLDHWQALKRLTFPKIWNASLLFASFQLSKITGRNYHLGRPLSIAIEPTTACNLRCPECPSGLRSFTRDTGNLKSDFFRDTIDQIATHAVSVILYFQGEPYINPAFLDMVSYARRKGLYTITSTNGHFLHAENAKRTVESGLDRLIISLDGTSQETYSAYRKGGELDTVIEGTRRIISWKKKLKKRTPHLIFQFLVVKPNEHQIPDLFVLAKELGVNEVRLKTAQLYDFKYGNALMPTQEKYARYRKQKDGTYALKYEITNACWKMWHSAVVTWNGLVVPCCFDKDANHKLGNLHANNLLDIWSGSKYEALRTQILRDRKGIEICNNCTEGCRVWA